MDIILLKKGDISPKFKEAILIRKEHNLLKKGLTSELFLLAFMEPDNIRKLGQRLQNTRGHPTGYSKASPAVHKLRIYNYLVKNGDGKFYPNIATIVGELEAILRQKDECLTVKEKKILGRFLQNRYFLGIVFQDVVEKIQKQPRGEHSVSALEILCEKLGGISAMLLHIRSINPDWKSRLDKFNQLSSPKMENKFNKFDKFAEKYSPILAKELKSVLDQVDVKNKELFIKLSPNILNLISPFMTLVISDVLLTKLCKLWNRYEDFDLAKLVFGNE